MSQQPNTRELFPIGKPRPNPPIGGYAAKTTTKKEDNRWSQRTIPRLTKYYDCLTKRLQCECSLEKVNKKESYMNLFASLDRDKVTPYVNRLRAPCGCFDGSFLDKCSGWCDGWKAFQQLDKRIEYEEYSPTAPQYEPHWDTDREKSDDV